MKPEYNDLNGAQEKSSNKDNRTEQYIKKKQIYNPKSVESVGDSGGR